MIGLVTAITNLAGTWVSAKAESTKATAEARATALENSGTVHSGLGTHHGRSIKELVERTSGWTIVFSNTPDPCLYTKYGRTYTSGVQRIGNFADLVS